MGNSKVDRDREYMRKMWGTTKLTSDYETFQPENDFLDNLANEQYQKCCVRLKMTTLMTIMS